MSELDVRRKPTRRPMHAGRSPRTNGNHQSPDTPLVDVDAFVVDKGRCSAMHSASKFTCKVPSQSRSIQNLNSVSFDKAPAMMYCGIPPDAGYEEISFSSSCAPMKHLSGSVDELSTHQSINRHRLRAKGSSDDIVNLHRSAASATAPKKLGGILKPPSCGYVDAGAAAAAARKMSEASSGLSTLAGYIPRETSWPSATPQKYVQWESNKDDTLECWDSKIDESHLLKELSYKYIKPNEALRDFERSMERLESDDINADEPMNLVQSRIRSFELIKEVDSTPIKEALAMQEPLKLSPPLVIEAHVSKMEANGNKKPLGNIREFALGVTKHFKDSPCARSHESLDVKSVDDVNKSVKDLLADFERKSQQVHIRQDSGGGGSNSSSSNKLERIKHHRSASMDTGSFLYDSGGNDREQQRECSSDVERHRAFTGFARIEKSMSIQSILNNTKEVLLQPPLQQPMDNVGEMKSALAMEDYGVKSPIDHQEQEDEDMTVVTNPGYMRLSVTESLVTHGDRLSGESAAASPTLKLDDANLEEHYLPMSPRKAILDPNSDDRPNPKILDNLFTNLHEESSYVEMTQNLISRSLLAPDDGGGGGMMKQGIGDYSTLDTPHYEFVCVADNKMEPVYMEVSQLANADEDRDDYISTLKSKRVCDLNAESLSASTTTTRFDLPDILTALNKSDDSSDADDESSKDLDSLDTPRHRFSLSDTYRPASYYLGSSSKTLIAELHDSSDSELVSPPPIPTSPPTLDDLDTLEVQDLLTLRRVLIG